MQPMADITEKWFSENILLHIAENIETIISTVPLLNKGQGIQYELYLDVLIFDVILPCNYMNLMRKHHN